MTAPDTIDLFAGPGGWSVAAAALSLRELGVELDPWACATRAAAGHLTVRADVAALPTNRMREKIKRLIGSPPCGTFSAAGKGEGVVNRLDIPRGSRHVMGRVPANMAGHERSSQGQFGWGPGSGGEL